MLAVVLDEARDGLEASGVPGEHPLPSQLPSSPPDLEVEEAGRRPDREDQTGGGGLTVSDEEAATTVLTQDIFSHRSADPAMVDERSESVRILKIFFLRFHVVIGISSP